MSLPSGQPLPLPWKVRRRGSDKDGEQQGGLDGADPVVTFWGFSFCVLGRQGLLSCTSGSYHGAPVTTTHLALIRVVV